MAIDRWAAAMLAPLVCWILLNGIDDLIIEIAWLFLKKAEPQPPKSGRCRSDANPRLAADISACHCRSAANPRLAADISACHCRSAANPRLAADISACHCRSAANPRIAMFVPLWNEHRVIERMVAQNTSSIKYSNYDIFIGAYPNDAPTLAAIAEARKRFPNVHLAQVPHDGPTSKADCLNWIYQRMLLFEEENGIRFEMVLTHDAEDVIHPEALTRIASYADRYDMIQIPVLALPTPWWELTHGAYCDEFAQMELLDMPVRQFMGGFIPSSGVGTAFSRNILERLARAYKNRIFEPACLTEDYEIGCRVNWLGGRQIFVGFGPAGSPIVATREYFPRDFRAAVRQRTRWITGIALQSWELHGFLETVWYAYWFWRDRKTLISNLVSVFANILTVYGIARGGLPLSKGLRETVMATLGLLAIHSAVRMSCAARIYGWKFAAATPLRMLWGNWINGLATSVAICSYFSAKLRRRPLRWVKTEHAYPNRAALAEHRRALEEILVESGYMSADELGAALASKPAERALIAHLLRQKSISEKDLYEAISLEQNLPAGKPEEVSVPVTRSFPAAVSRRWQVLPFKVVAGSLHVAGSEPPTDQMHEELRTFSSMEIRFQLITPTEFEELAKEYLPEPAVGIPLR